ncbi:MAG: hypothetical protein HYZ49_01920 [Chloroflexi bacterium]|nr:hypothetical protein [Chloroflexota bacterium]
MSAKKLKSVGLITGAIVLAFAGFWLLLISTQPGVVQGQDSWPTLIPPDLTVAAEFANMPSCCNDEKPIYETPSEEQIVLLTQAAESPQANTNVPVETLVPEGQILAPSDGWVTYKDPIYGYTFDYPANWFVENDGVTTIVHNVSPGAPPKYSLSFLNIWIGPREDIVAYGSFETYLNDPKHTVPAEWLISQDTKTLPNGYQIVQRKQKAVVGTGFLFIYLTDGNQVYEIHVNELNSPYLDVVDRLIESFTIPQ